MTGMKFIAHRGASLEAQENTLDSLRIAASLGAFACECDIRKTKDGRYVLFHDSDLKRLTGFPDRLGDITADEMRERLASAGKSFTEYTELLSEDFGDSSILCDIGNDWWKCTDDFFKMLYDAPFRVICGIHRPEEAALASKYFPREQILAFIPDKSQAKEFYDAGAGGIRLWEGWIAEITPSEVKSLCPGAEVYIMSDDPLTGLNGSERSIDRLRSLGADAILLNDIRMATDYCKKVSEEKT
jgi:hypothetical protein